MHFHHLRRREFITLLGGAAVAWPLKTRAQQAQRRIGVLIPLAKGDVDSQTRVGVFQKTLQQLGWTDGSNIRIEYRWIAEADRVQGPRKSWFSWHPM
jgi:putative tryptophan/tyrosine transport system substrate-binding protein